MSDNSCRRPLEGADLSRRSFIQGAATAAAGVAVGSAAAAKGMQGTGPHAYKSILPQSILGANERILTGHIGTGGMGKRNLQFCLMRDDIQPIAVCDLWEPNRNQAVDIVTNKYDAPSTHVYFEELLDNKDIDAVVVVTPDHWHAIPTIMACEAGKDVWCEKPLTTSIAEGYPLVDAVRRTKRVLQCGNFQRSGEHFQKVVDMVRNGHIGKVARVETWIHDDSSIEGIGNPPDEDPPEGLDWDRYTGWTKKVPFNQNRFLYNFRWFLDYSGGKMTDWGAHLIDIVLWAMGEDKTPKRITSLGGKLVLTDNRTTPDVLDVLYDFGDYILSFSNRVYNGFVERNRYGIMFYGTEGTIFIDREGYEVIPKRGAAVEPEKLEGVLEGDMNQAHWQNFVDCLKSRKDPISSVESAFNTSKICHMGTTAYVAGGQLDWDNAKQRFTGSDEKAVDKANAWAFREYENGWALEPPYYEAWKA